MQAIHDRGIDYVAQEAVTLSTMPVWRDGRLQPRPFTLRLFLAEVGDGWQVMPGGFVRIAEHADARAVSLQRGGATADAWVLSEGPVVETTLLPAPERMADPARDRHCCRAAPPTICSGSAATSNAPKRRCGWCARCSTAIAEADDADRAGDRSASASCSAPGARRPIDPAGVRRIGRARGADATASSTASLPRLVQCARARRPR